MSRRTGAPAAPRREGRPPTGPALARAVGVPGAVLMGLGSILGTGIFVSLGIASGVAGPSVVLAVVLAAVVATCNGLSAAQLAASHPVSGGTYEYGYRYLNPTLGFVAGWLFLCAKTASAATAALGCAGYVLVAGGGGGPTARVALGVAAVAVLTAVVAGGIRRSNRANAVIVAVTLLALGAFVAAGLSLALDRAPAHFADFFPSGGADGGGGAALLHGTALLFDLDDGTPVYEVNAPSHESVMACPERSRPRSWLASHEIP